MNFPLLIIQAFCVALLTLLIGTGIHYIIRRSPFSTKWGDYSDSEKRIALGWVLLYTGFITYLMYEFIGMNFWYDSGNMLPGKSRATCM
tara:strand:+ start:480 stop:746 length:267 start_codon:yes stop_codon:yes gene_type:complete